MRVYAFYRVWEKDQRLKMNEQIVRDRLASSGDISSDIFSILKFISNLANSEASQRLARELIIRTLAVKDKLPHQYAGLIDSLVRTVGLFPYAELSNTATLDEQVLVEAHRASGLGPDSLFHRLQLDVYRELINGRNVVLSATTSVGKSRVIDAVIASHKHKCVVIIVPTIALIDETRRRLSQYFSDTHDIITHPSQSRLEDGRPVIYVLTQERALNRDDLSDVDFLVIDEFYKLDLRNDVDERAIDLNLCFHKFVEYGAQFYLIGPHINSVEGLPPKYRHTFIPSDFATVALDISTFSIKRNDVEGRKEKLVQICSSLSSPTLIYCQSPAKAREAAETLIKRLRLTENPATADAVDWLEKYYPSEWIVIQALRLGIGIHHGNVPRALQQYMVRAFENRYLHYIVCTSTIIEGVNTVAENVIIYDRRINNTNLDYFTFRNIAGRAGRMKKYFIGKVFVLEEPPEEVPMTVELPVENQDENTPMSLLLDLPKASLSRVSQGRLEDAFEGSPLTEATIRANRYIPIDHQNEIYEYIAENRGYYAALLSWTGIPSPDQLKAVCDLIYRYVDRGARLNGHRVFSGEALYAELVSISASKDLRGFILDKITRKWDNEEITDVIERVLKFQRNYIGYSFGRQLMALSRIQAEAIGTTRGKIGDYSLYAALAENLFMPSGLRALDEYGIPPELALRLAQPGKSYETLDDALKLVAHTNVDGGKLTSFERELVENVRSALPSRAFA
jgi:hypothetical protein